MTTDFDYSAFRNLENHLESEIKKRLIPKLEYDDLSVINQDEKCQVLVFGSEDGYILLAYDSDKLAVIDLDSRYSRFAGSDVILSSQKALALVFSEEVAQQYFDLKSQKKAIQDEKNKAQKENQERDLYEQLKKKFEGK